VRDAIEYVVQVNGKLRGRVSVPAAAGQDEVRAQALADEQVQRHVAGKDVKKVIVVRASWSTSWWQGKTVANSKRQAASGRINSGPGSPCPLFTCYFHLLLATDVLRFPSPRRLLGHAAAGACRDARDHERHRLSALLIEVRNALLGLAP